MRPLHRYLKSAIPIVLVILTGCRSKPSGEDITNGPPRQEPIVPAGYQKIAPASVSDSREMLAQTATIFRGTLKSVQFTYDSCSGPRTNYIFSDASPLLGTAVDSTVTLKVLGGPTPSGRWVGVSELPKLALDSEYVAFLRNTDWTYSPIVGNLVFRVEKVAGREVLIHPDGHAVTGWDSDGPLLSAGAVSELVGSKQRGYKAADAPLVGDQPSSGTPDGNGHSGTPNGGTSIPPRSTDSTLARAPTAEQIRKAGLFARPELLASAIANEQTLSVDTLATGIRAAAERAQVKVGGRLTLDPDWKCWSSTPTARVVR